MFTHSVLFSFICIYRNVHRTVMISVCFRASHQIRLYEHIQQKQKSISKGNIFTILVFCAGAGVWACEWQIQHTRFDSCRSGAEKTHRKSLFRPEHSCTSQSCSDSAQHAGPIGLVCLQQSTTDHINDFHIFNRVPVILKLTTGYVRRSLLFNRQTWERCRSSRR